MLILRAGNISVPHGFFGRQGGVSTGLYESLNCGPGSGDDRASVIANRERVRAALGAEALVTLGQVHSPDVVTLGAAWDIGAQPPGDAMVTAVPGIALGILTADCAPVLFADAQAGVIGAAHAGWKGAIGGVVANTVAAMEALGARRSRIAAAIGPCISQANYEVGPEFHDRFVAANGGFARFFAAAERPSHLRFDLAGFVADRLAIAGVDRIETLDACTYARPADFFSFRRATHRGENDYGREISAIVLR